MVTVPDGCSTADTDRIICQLANTRNVGAPNDTTLAAQHAQGMLTTTTTETPMFRNHLTRLFVTAVSLTVVIAAFAPFASAGMRSR